MKYAEYEDKGRFLEVNEKKITPDYLISQLEYIKRGWLPDYHSCTAYTKDEKKPEPTVVYDSNYPNHVAMMVAIQAIERLKEIDPKFFDNMDYRFE